MATAGLAIDEAVALTDGSVTSEETGCATVSSPPPFISLFSLGTVTADGLTKKKAFSRLPSVHNDSISKSVMNVSPCEPSFSCASRVRSAVIRKTGVGISNFQYVVSAILAASWYTLWVWVRFRPPLCTESAIPRKENHKYCV